MGNSVLHYEKRTTEIPVYFPNGEIVCKWCRLFLRYEDAFQRYSCRLTDEWILDPAHEIGQSCPLTFGEDRP